MQLRKSWSLHRWGISPLLFAVAFASAQPVANLEALKGKTVPDFTLRDLGGRKHPFKNFRGKVILLNFWSPH